ncbi:quinone oxidoreductase family protein [Sphingomonas profundi]|uniref:quinone oxidoreductase family protein n=1 Tax=Alterirhizorhabdus profundi TaxID=2681549 RepID=UPI0012E8C39A|nr:zinc-binding alcohol dehydrogenase family protein [Sphingomonas profundi]
MRAWQIEAQTGAQDLRLVDLPRPTISGTEVLVRVTAPGVVPFDGAIINDENEANFPPASFPIIPGNQGAGIVEDAGASSFAVGDRVMFGAFPYGFMRPGSWADYVAVEADHMARIPASVPDGAAAQAAVAYPTAYRALKEAGMAPGKTVLATGIGGSVGNAAYQLARAMGAAKVFSTTSSPDKAAKAAEAGFDNVIDMSKEAIADGVMARNGGVGVDIIIDSLGGAVIGQAVKCLVRYGKAIVLGFAAGRGSTITLADLILVRGSIQGYGVYTCTPDEWREAWDDFTRFADQGTVKPLFDRSFPFDEAPAALKYMSTARPFGSVALTM